ncbi:MAG: DedA family protein [Thermoplasmata archaeon]|nr:DedA family protein [Thermoplasmata archaeon]
MVSIPIIETVVSLIMTVMTVGGLAGLILLMSVESFGIPPLPSEIILPFAGFMIASGTLSWPGAVIAAMLGGLIGSYAAYGVGRWGRTDVLEKSSGFLRLDPKHLAQMDAFFRRRGESTVLVSRLIPVIRSYISYPAGSARMEPVRFGVFTAIGAFPFTMALLYAGFVLQGRWADIVPYFRIADYFALVLIVLGLGYIALRWRGLLAPGFPPKLIPRSSPRPPDTPPNP